MILSTEREKVLFWDVDVDTLDLRKHASYIIARVLEKGNLEDIKNLLTLYSREEIIAVICSSGQISQRTAYFWKTVFNINQPIRCLEKNYQTLQQNHWKS